MWSIAKWVTGGMLAVPSLLLNDILPENEYEMHRWVWFNVYAKIVPENDTVNGMQVHSEAYNLCWLQLWAWQLLLATKKTLVISVISESPWLKVVTGTNDV